MKRSYSQKNVLGKRLSSLGEEAKGLVQSLFSPSRTYVEVDLPYYEYLRGKVFVDDLKEQYEEEVPYHFTVSFLIYILYDDFLMQVKRGARPEDIANYLVKGKARHSKGVYEEKRIMKPISKRSFSFETEMEEKKVQEKRAYITLRIKERELLRCEVLLHDLAPLLKDIEVSVEEVMTIVYLDFIQEVIKEGNQKRIQTSILEYLKHT